MEPGTPNPPCVMVVQPRFGIAKRFYKLYVLPRELVCVWIGGPTNFFSRRILSRVRELDEKPFEQQRGDHDHNFSLLVEEIESARLTKASLWFHLAHWDVNEVGLLRVKLVAGDELTLALSTGYDARTAMTELPRVLGAKLLVETTMPAGDPCFEYGGMTVLLCDSSHGNQFEFLDLDGRCYLWYPGNVTIVEGRWRIDGQQICFKYGWGSYNPVTGTLGGWQLASLAQFTANILDAVPGDVCRLAAGRIPYVLSPDSGFQSVREAIHTDAG